MKIQFVKNSEFSTKENPDDREKIWRKLNRIDRDVMRSRPVVMRAYERSVFII